MTSCKSSGDIRKFYICPSCNALCEEGHDDEFQITCGNCSKSFRSDKAKCVGLSMAYLCENFKRVTLMRSGWTAYIPIEE